MAVQIYVFDKGKGELETTVSEATESETCFYRIHLWFHFLYFCHRPPPHGLVFLLTGCEEGFSPPNCLCFSVQIISIFPADSDGESDLSSDDEGDIQVSLLVTGIELTVN